MQSRTLAALVGAALIWLDGSARAEEAGKVPDAVSSDRWDVSAKDGTATVASASRDATILIGCSEGDPSMALMVTLMTPVAFSEQFRTVTIVFDGGRPVSQSWFSTKDSYGITEEELTFPATVEGLISHQTVEFVLSEDGKELDRHSFTLNGAKSAIGSVVRTCHRNG